LRLQVDGEFRPAQHDLGQFVELACLLIVGESRRSEVTGKRERRHARKHERPPM